MVLCVVVLCAVFRCGRGVVVDRPHGRVRILGHAALDLMHNWPEAIPCSPTFVADVVAGSFRSAVDIRGGPRSYRCVSPLILAQSIDDRNVHANWLRAYRPSSIGQDTGESQGWDAKDVGRPAATVKGEDIQKNVWGLADWSQPRPLTEIEVNVSDPIVQRGSVSPRHT